MLPTKMKNSVMLIIAFVLFFTSCKHENINTRNVKEELQVVKRLCFIKSFYRKEKNYAALDFIEHIKISDIDSKATYPQIIELPDKFCYVNKEIIFEDYEISDSVKIIMQKFSYDAEGNYKFNQSITLMELLAEFDKSKHVRFLNSPYEIEIINNKIISLKEIYIP